MRYMCLIYGEQAWHNLPAADKTTLAGEYVRLTDELRKSGHYLAGDPLQHTKTAKTVSIRNGKLEATDGPFAETKEQLGGYFMIDAMDMDEATAIAARIPGARMGWIEVRPILELPNERSP